MKILSPGVTADLITSPDTRPDAVTPVTDDLVTEVGPSVGEMITFSPEAPEPLRILAALLKRRVALRLALTLAPHKPSKAPL